MKFNFIKFCIVFDRSNVIISARFEIKCGSERFSIFTGDFRKSPAAPITKMLDKVELL